MNKICGMFEIHLNLKHSFLEIRIVRQPLFLTAFLPFLYHLGTSYTKLIQHILFQKLSIKFYSIIFIRKKPYHVNRSFSIFRAKFNAGNNRYVHRGSQFFHNIDISNSMMICNRDTFEIFCSSLI